MFGFLLGHDFQLECRRTLSHAKTEPQEFNFRVADRWGAIREQYGVTIRQRGRNMRWLSGLRISRWTGIALQFVMFPAVHAGVPWALSLVGSRHGWVGDRPAFSNFAGLLPVIVGFYILILCTREHFLAAPDGWLLERTRHYPTPAYLLTDGPYRYSCNPIYMAELVIWLGWIVFYGSLVMAAIVVAAALLVGPVIVPREERGLDVRFGEAYREFRRTTPRWLGKRRR